MQYMYTCNSRFVDGEPALKEILSEKDKGRAEGFCAKLAITIKHRPTICPTENFDSRVSFAKFSIGKLATARLDFHMRRK